MTKDLKNPLEPTPIPTFPPEGEGAFIEDEFHGVGGSYILDPATGKRTRNQTINEAEIDSQAISKQQIDN